MATATSEASGAIYATGAVLFDLDGTLADSSPGITAAINATLVAIGSDEVPVAELMPRIGPPLHETFSALLAEREPSPSELDEVVADYRRRYAQGMVAGSSPYAGIHELLAALHEQERILAVATSKAQPLAQVLLDDLGLGGFFTAVCGPVPPSRETKTQTVRKALGALGRHAHGAVMIGDRLHDIEGARANGLPSIGVLHGFGSRDELQRAGADAIAPGVPELARLLGVA